MKKLHVLLEQIGGCGDGGCMIHVRPGMHTNGGCRCSTDPLKMRQTVHTYKGAVAAQAQEIERLSALVKDAYEEGWDDATCQPMGFDDNWNHSITRAALQPKEGNQ